MHDIMLLGDELTDSFSVECEGRNYLFRLDECCYSEDQALDGKVVEVSFDHGDELGFEEIGNEFFDLKG